jgi:hypothetical protein
MGSAGCGSRAFEGLRLRVYSTRIAVDIVASFLNIRGPYHPDLPARVSVLLTPAVGRKARFNVPTMGSAGCGSRAFEGLRLRVYSTRIAVDIVASFLNITRPKS